MHLRHEWMGLFNFSPFRVVPVAPSSGPWEQSGLIAIYESANFGMNFHPRGVD
jgi:hypothetical protein